MLYRFNVKKLKFLLVYMVQLYKCCIDILVFLYLAKYSVGVILLIGHAHCYSMLSQLQPSRPTITRDGHLLR